MWKEIADEIEAIPKRQYSQDEDENIKMKKKLLDSNLRKFISALM